jgi:hypothetical protein
MRTSDPSSAFGGRSTPNYGARQATRAFDGFPAKVPALIPSTGTDSVTSVTDPDPSKGGPISAVVVPTMRPERSTSILHEKFPVTELTVKFTCSAGIPWLANCGLYGSRVAVTEVTFAGKFPEIAARRELPLVDAGVELHPANDAPTIIAIAKSGHGRITGRS